MKTDAEIEGAVKEARHILQSQKLEKLRKILPTATSGDCS